VSGFYSGMGSDRIADIIAAWSEFGQKTPVAVIGLGTATAITAASADGKFRGGFTTLGLEPLCQSLTTALPALPPIDPRKVSDIKPRFDVYNALCSGTVAGYLGIIEKWVSILKDELGSDLTVIATGGWSEFIGPKTNCVHKIDPLLTVKGILAIARNGVQASGRV
jgi:type III pantothenate kinase